MYRNCKKCCAFNNHMATFNEDAIETKCNNVNNSMNMANWANYEDECKSWIWAFYINWIL